MTPRLLAIAAAGALALGVLAPATAADASTPKHYANCTAVHKVYSGGIAKQGVKYNTVSGKHKPLKGKVKFDTALYTANKALDRDKDGIACELS